jgi:subtilisin family serine protease
MIWNRKTMVLFIGILFVFVLLVPVKAEPLQRGPRKIVVFEETFVNEAAKQALIKNFGAEFIKTLPLINGAAVYLPPQAEKALEKRKGIEILRIDKDLIIHATKKPSKPGKPEPQQPDQEIPWGIDRIEADLVWDVNTANTIKVAVLDSGIDLTHPDLAANIKGNFNAINPRKSAKDDNGHGTHVAGTIGALNNTIGVVGVCPDIDLYAVKALNRNGDGYLSDVIDGLHWCVNNGMQVINMSLGASSGNQSFHDAIIAVYDAGIVQVAAAGNESVAAVNYPAWYPETIAVSAIDEFGNFASFSNYGPEIDVTAPGVNVKSTYKGGTYAIANGTSMATPHAAGVAALILTKQIETYYDLDLDGVWSPDEVKAKLQDSTEFLGLPVEMQGAGLVRADLAVN